MVCFVFFAYIKKKCRKNFYCFSVCKVSLSLPNEKTQAKFVKVKACKYLQSHFYEWTQLDWLLLIWCYFFVCTYLSVCRYSLYVAAFFISNSCRLLYCWCEVWCFCGRGCLQTWLFRFLLCYQLTQKEVWIYHVLCLRWLLC